MVSEFVNGNVSYRDRMNNLGNGCLHTGKLLSRDFKLELVNSLEDGFAITRCVATRDNGVGEEPTTIHLGVILNKQLKENKRIIGRGFVDEEGIFTKDESGDVAFFLKDKSGGLNNCNVVWVDWDKFSQMHELIEVGVVRPQDEGQTTFQVAWNDESDPGNPSTLALAKVMDVNTDTLACYAVSTNAENVGVKNVMPIGNEVHLAVSPDGTSPLVRYKIDMENNKVWRLDCKSIPARTMDFTPKYTYDNLLNSLLQNIKRFMLNRIVNVMVNSVDDTSIMLDDCNFGSYLDMFTTQISYDTYRLAMGSAPKEDVYGKFSQIFENNAVELDESGIYLGALSNHLEEIVNAAFANGNIVIADEPSFRVKRVNGVDEFTYNVVLDVYLYQRNDWLKNHYLNFKEKFVVGNAIVKDVVCEVKFVPKFNKGSEEITYDVQYKIVGKPNCEVEYNQIIYNLNGKTKHKTIQTQVVSVDVPEGAVAPSTGMKLDNLTNEILTGKIQELFTNDYVCNLLAAVNNNIPADHKIQVDTVLQLNTKHPSGWGIDEPVPTDIDGSLMSTSAGFTEIDDIVYSLELDENGKYRILQAIEGDGQIGIEEIEEYEYEYKDEYEFPSN